MEKEWISSDVFDELGGDIRYGLRGLQSLVEDGGGRVRVDSTPGDGTTVRMAVERR